MHRKQSHNMPHEAAVKKAAGALFSEGTLADKTRLAMALSEMPGLDPFMMKLPWCIKLVSGEIINGLSENLYFAAKDIHSHLIALADNFSPDTITAIEVDEARLPAQRPLSQPLKGLDGT